MVAARTNAHGTRTEKAAAKRQKERASEGWGWERGREIALLLGTGPCSVQCSVCRQVVGGAGRQPAYGQEALLQVKRQAVV